MRKFDAKKVEMSQVFAEDGKAVPVTYIKAEAIPDDLTVGAKVKVTGISKGKGFQGVVKRWHFAGGPKTHGQSDRWRAPGSIGMRTTPGRVWKGKKMPGHMGDEKVSVRNLKVVAVDKEKKLVAISGAVPGARNGRIVISY